MQQQVVPDKRLGDVLTVGIEVTFSAQYSSTALILLRMMEQAVRAFADADHHPQAGLIGAGDESRWRRCCLLVGDDLITLIIDTLGFDFAALTTGDTEIRNVPIGKAPAIHVHRVCGFADTLIGFGVTGRRDRILAAGFLILLEITFEILSAYDDGKGIT